MKTEWLGRAPDPPIGAPSGLTLWLTAPVPSGLIWAAPASRSPVRGTLNKDRDRPGTYMEIAEFGSDEDAMANSRLPVTTAFAACLEILFA